MTPADVLENLMPKSVEEDTCLENLIKAFEENVEELVNGSIINV